MTRLLAAMTTSVAGSCAGVPRSRSTCMARDGGVLIRRSVAARVGGSSLVSAPLLEVFAWLQGVVPAASSAACGLHNLDQTPRIGEPLVNCGGAVVPDREVDLTDDHVGQIQAEHAGRTRDAACTRRRTGQIRNMARDGATGARAHALGSGRLLRDGPLVRLRRKRWGPELCRRRPTVGSASMPRAEGPRLRG
jgi:hypothetical protein